MRFAALRDAIIEREKSLLERDLKRKFFPSIIASKMRGLDLCRKVRSLKDLGKVILGRERSEVEIAKKGDTSAYWDYRYATVEARKVMALLEGATSTKAMVGKRAAKELASAMGEEE